MDYEPWLIDSIAENPPCTGGAPAVTNVSANPNPVAIEKETTLTATVDDSNSGGSNIVSAEYSTDGGTTWEEMDATDEWGLSSGKNAYSYSSEVLDEYYQRDARHKVRPTEAARDFAGSSHS